MKLYVDSREQLPLEFPQTVGVEVVPTALPLGDYGASYGDRLDPTVIERKSISDLFTSFTSGYEAERAKILKAITLELSYILAIEATASEILKGHSYWQAGERHEAKKTGLAMLRQLMMLQRKYGIAVWFCTTRTEMAWRILEFFLAGERCWTQAQKETS